MSTSTKALVSVFALLGPLALGGCEGTAPELRPRFGSGGQNFEGWGLSTYELAKADFAAGRYGLAIKHFQMAVAEDPGSIESLNGLAAAYDQIGRFDLAERFYRRAQAANPNSVQTLNNLGYSLYLQGRYDLAVALLRDAARIDTDNSIVESNLSMSDAALESAELDRTVASAAPEVTTASIVDAAQPETVLLLGPGVTAWVEPRIVRVSEQIQQLRADKPAQAAGPDSSGNEVAEPAQGIHPILVNREIPLEAAVKVSKGQLGAASALSIEGVQLAPPALPARRPVEYVIVTEAQTSPAYTRSDVERGAQSAMLTPGTIETSNGTGRRRMAARLRDYLNAKGLPVAGLSNADHFRHATSTITYRPDYRGLAESVAKHLPIAVTLRMVNEQATAVRIELGGDLLDFDRQLLQTRGRT